MTKCIIIEETNTDGSKDFIPQYKGWFRWKYFTCFFMTGIRIICFKSEEQAKNFIDNPENVREYK